MPKNPIYGAMVACLRGLETTFPARIKPLVMRRTNGKIVKQPPIKTAKFDA